MKLRIAGNTLRFRLTPEESMQLGRGEPLQSTTRFGPSSDVFKVSLEPADVQAFQASFREGHIRIRIPMGWLAEWYGKGQGGLYDSIVLGVEDLLEIAVEKDFPQFNKQVGKKII